LKFIALTQKNRFGCFFDSTSGSFLYFGFVPTDCPFILPLPLVLSYLTVKNNPVKKSLQSKYLFSFRNACAKGEMML